MKIVKIDEKMHRHEIMLLDTPTEYLCGPWVGFSCEGQFLLFKNCDKDHPYQLLNLKGGPSVNRLTVEFDEQAGQAKGRESRTRVSMQFYADVYFSKENLNCLFFYSVRNTSAATFEGLRIYNLFDFDIGGLSEYDSDFVVFDPGIGAIMQYDGDVHVGFASLPEFPVAHHAGGHPYELVIDHLRPSLDDQVLEGPDDFFSGLEWNLGDLPPGGTATLPIVLAAGESRKEFIENLVDGREKAAKILPTMPKIINQPERQERINDGAIKKMNESLKNLRSNDNC